MRRELEDAVKDERTTLKEDIAPVPAVVLDDIVSLGLDPKVERDESDAADPPESSIRFDRRRRGKAKSYLIMWSVPESPSGTRKHEKANMQYARKSLRAISTRTGRRERGHELEQDDVHELAEEQPCVVL